MEGEAGIPGEADIAREEEAFLSESPTEPTSFPGVRDSRKRSSASLSFTSPTEIEADLISAPRFKIATKG
jgi:hypothetical protein